MDNDSLGTGSRIRVSNPAHDHFDRYGNVTRTSGESLLESEVAVELDNHGATLVFPRADLEDQASKTTCDTYDPQAHLSAPTARFDIGQQVITYADNDVTVRQRRYGPVGWSYRVTDTETGVATDEEHEENLFASQDEKDQHELNLQRQEFDTATTRLDSSLRRWQRLADTVTDLKREVITGGPAMDSYEEWYEPGPPLVCGHEVDEIDSALDGLADRFEALAGRYRRRLHQLRAEEKTVERIRDEQALHPEGDEFGVF